MVKTAKSGQHYPQAADHLVVLSMFHLFDCSQSGYLYNFDVDYWWATGLPVRYIEHE